MQKFNTPRVWNPQLHLRTLEANQIEDSNQSLLKLSTSRVSPDELRPQLAVSLANPISQTNESVSMSGNPANRIRPSVQHSGNLSQLKILLKKILEMKKELVHVRTGLGKEFANFALMINPGDHAKSLTILAKKKRPLMRVHAPLKFPKTAELKTHVQALLGSILIDVRDIILHQVIPQCQYLAARSGADLQSQLMSEIKLRRELHNQLIELKGNIRVFIRVRPVLREETSCTTCDTDENIITLQKGSAIKQFQFDKIFGPQTDNNKLFSELSQLLTSVLDGYNVSIIAYGITGSGKTFTMEGIYERIGLELFQKKSEREGRNWGYNFRFSMCEVYNESVIDLLNLKNLSVGIKTNPNNGLFHIPGLTNNMVKSPGEFRNFLTQGGANRSVSSTNCNEQSSRSHLITIITVQIKTPNGKEMESKIHLVDLAGSERLDKSGATGSVAKEAVFINKSLSALGDVINSRFNKASHVPYRNSVLTSVLQETLCGDAKTMMILQVSPCEKSFDETCNSLVFGTRVKEVELRNPSSPRKRIN